MSCRVVSRPSDRSKIREDPQALMVTSLEIRRFHPTGRSKNGKRNRATRRVVYWHWVCEEKGTSLRERRWVSRVSCQQIELLEVLVICLRSTYVSPPATLSTVSKIMLDRIPQAWSLRAETATSDPFLVAVLALEQADKKSKSRVDALARVAGLLLSFVV